MVTAGGVHRVPTAAVAVDMRVIKTSVARRAPSRPSRAGMPVKSIGAHASPNPRRTRLTSSELSGSPF